MKLKTRTAAGMDTSDTESEQMLELNPKLNMKAGTGTAARAADGTNVNLLH